MQIIYVNPGDSSVMEAQVLSLIRYYGTLKKFNDVILVQGYKNKAERIILERKIKEFKPNLMWFKSWPEFTYFEYFTFHSLSRVLDRLPLDDQTIIHARGELFGAKVKKYLDKRHPGAKLLVDIRGVAFEHFDNYYMRNRFLKNNKGLLFRKVYEKIKNDVQITVVSQALKDYLTEEHGFCAGKICVHPNIAGEHFFFDQTLRDTIRKELNYDQDDVVAICSSNGAGAWQKDKDVVMRLLNLNVRVINLSPTKLEIVGVTNKLVSFSSMPGYLSAADIAILWRDNNPVNTVASPSKFSEFASMGLWVIHNGTIKLAKEYIEENGFGFIVDSPGSITEIMINSCRNYDRLGASLTGRRSFGVEYVADSYILTYNKLLGAN